MNDWNALLDALRAFNLPPSEYVIVGSGPLWAAGLVDAPRDLDVLARGAAWENIKTLAAPFVAPRGDLCVALCDGKLEIFGGWTPAVWTIDAIFAAAVFYDGLPFAPLAFVRAVKLALHRPQDQAHLALMNSERIPRKHRTITEGSEMPFGKRKGL